MKRFVWTLAALAMLSCDKGAAPPAPASGADKPAAKGLPPATAATPLPPDHPKVETKGGDALAGTIDVAPAMKDQVKPGDTIFLVARSIDAAGNVQRMPVAVDRLSVGTLPMTFELTSAHVMVAGAAFSGSMQLTARVDKDGEAMTRQEGDVEGTVKVTVPQKGVQIVLDTPVKP